MRTGTVLTLKDDATGTAFTSDTIRIGEEEITLIIVDNSTDKTYGVTYEGSIDGEIWVDLVLAAGDDPVSLTTGTQNVQVLTDPWPFVHVIVDGAVDTTGTITVQWASRRARQNIL